MTSIQRDIRTRFQFEYTTVTRLRAEGILAADLSDADARIIIRTMSKVINNVTGQWFWPIESKERLRGAGYSVLSHPSQIPILELRSLEAQFGNTTSAYSSDAYSVSLRDIHLNNVGYRNISNRIQTVRPKFTRERPLNVIADGTWGWLENQPFVSDPFDSFAKVETTTAEELALDDEEVDVTDGSGFRAGDVVIFRSGAAGTTYSGHAILTEVDGNTLSFDAVQINTATLASGATVITYGQIPQPVERACLITSIKFKDDLATADATEAALKSRIIRERTDNFEYQLSKNEGSISDISTGDAQADRLLSTYHSPPYIGAV